MADTAFHDSRDDNGDGFCAEIEVRSGWLFPEPTPLLTLDGSEGRVTAFGVGEIEALKAACERALASAQRVRQGRAA